jgi:hypothetical protein
MDAQQAGKRIKVDDLRRILDKSRDKNPGGD